MILVLDLWLLGGGIAMVVYCVTKAHEDFRERRWLSCALGAFSALSAMAAWAVVALGLMIAK